MIQPSRHRSGYLWVPTLYFAEALPYVAVMTIAAIMYKKMGLSNTDLALYTSWLYLPWVIKPLWGPLLDAFKTKRWWILTMQLLIGAGFAGIAFTLQTDFWLQASLAFFWLVALSSATHDIAADGLYILALNSQEQAFYVGIRSTFYRIATIVGQGLLVMLAGWIELHSSVPMSWTVTFYVLCAFFLLLVLYHRFFLPKVENDDTAQPVTLRTALQSFAVTLRTFFAKPHIVSALLFMLLFRFPEAQLGKISSPFMLDNIEAGGLGLTTQTVGFVYGTVGIIALTLGGLLGGFLVSHDGLRRWLWPMVLAISLPDAIYIFLSATQTQNLWLISTSVFVEQFGYGFGFTAYMLYLVYFARGENSTSVYAICTAFMALGMMLPGMVAGKLADWLGYTGFFVYVFVSCLVTVAVCLKLKVED